MKKLTARRLGVAAAFVILIAAFAIARLLSEMKEPPQRRPAFQADKEVQVMRVENRSIPSGLDVQGQLVAFDKIELFAEVSGTLEESERPFKVGSYFPKGAVLARIDDDEARLNLLAQKSELLNAITQLMPDLKVDYPMSFDNWKSYLDAFELDGNIRPLPEAVSEQEKYFVASRNIYSLYYGIESAEERLSKYVMRAPFSGVLTEASIHPGALVRVGQKLGELMSTGYYELEATVPLSDLTYIKPGNSVRLSSDDLAGAWTGTVKRINDQVDPSTQTVKVFIGVRGKQLREGMYLTGEIAAGAIDGAIKIPRKLLVDQNAVFEVQDTLLRKHQVEIVRFVGDSAIIRGLDDNTVLLSEMIPDAFDGMRVHVAGDQDSHAPATSAVSSRE